MSSEAEVQSDF